MSAELKRFMTDYALLEYFSNAILSRLQQAIDARGQAYLVVSGGRTPLPLFERLAQQKFAWDKVTITLADDRWVATNHDDSNERLVRQHLLVKEAAAATFIGLVGALQDIEADVVRLNEQLQSLPTFDVVILGMGNDGHTASLFPCSDELEAGLTTTAPALAVHPKTAPHGRISLSRERLLNTRQLYLHVSGADKANVVQSALENPATDSQPISLFLQQDKVPMQVLLACA